MSNSERSSAGKAKFSALTSVVAFIVIILTAGFYFYPFDQFQRKSAEVRDAVTLGLAHESLASLAMIAHDQGFFKQAGLDVRVKEYASGKLALKGLLAGEVSLATSADIPIVFNSFNRRDFSIVSTIGSSDNEPRIIARKDRGINTPADLRGKRVATQRASAVHFFLHMFLLQSGMGTDDIELSFIKGKNLPQALASGEIDAFSMREPFIGEASKLLGDDNVVIFSKPGLYRKTFNIVAAKSLIQDRPGVVRKLLNALIQAESYSVQQPEEAINIVANTLETTPANIAAIWPDVSLKVSLDQSLLLGLEDEAKWVIENKLNSEDQVPSYLDYIYVDALKAVDPILVSLVH